MKPYDKKSKKFLVTTLCMLAGNALLAFLVAAFIIPHDIIMGGTTGIGIVLSRVIPGLDVSTLILILNLLLLLLAGNKGETDNRCHNSQCLHNIEFS
jgi:uncharacterized membrane-anchored protein YitT (DUF2179 family)